MIPVQVIFFNLNRDRDLLQKYHKNMAIGDELIDFQLALH